MSLSPMLRQLVLGVAAASPLLAVDAPAPAPAASAESKLTLGAYGELHYNNFMDQAKSDQIDLHRLVLMAEYSFNDRMRFVGEVEIEHGLVEDTDDGSGPGELEVEQAYVEFDVHEKVSVKGGVMLIPASHLNLYHEPATFHGVERPNVEKVIIPSTWWEAGFGARGAITDELDYQVTLTSSLDNAGFSSSGIRGGRQKAAKAKANSFMFAGRLNYQPMPELRVGTSLLLGNTGQTEDDPSTPADEKAADGMLTLFEADGSYTWRMLELSATAAIGNIDDADEIGNGTPEQFYGFYVTAAYDLFHHWDNSGDQTFHVFARYENWDTQSKVPSGVTKDDSKTGDIIQLGVTYKPIENIAVKADYQDWSNDADTAIDQFNLGIGFHY